MVSHPTSPIVKYRADIDGLRALAVMSVLIFHIMPGRMQGGFVGVDVFFVISGYLIGSILIDRIDAGRFSIVDFYESRIRRILPALFVVILFVMAVSTYSLYPASFLDTAYSVLSTLASASNLYFMATSDYFDDGAAEKPLLHTWSLGVEEQFYIFFPLILMLIARFAPRYRPQVLGVTFVASFGLAAVATFKDPMVAFYGPHTRAWELLIGVFLALGAIKTPGRVTRNVLAVVGLALILVPVFAYNALTPFPGLAALPPVLGAALLIQTGGGTDKTLVSRFFSLPPVVFVGQISYSLYLWHWPVFRLLLGPAANLTSKAGLTDLKPWMLKMALVALTFVLATLSWRFVERPFRKAPHGPNQKKVFGVAVTVSAVFAVAALGGVLSQGWPQRFSPEVVRLADYVNYKHPEYRENQCFLTSRSHLSDYEPDICLKRSDTRPNYMLVGDSHGAHLWYGLSQALDVNLMQATASGCKPTVSQPSSASERCRILIQRTYQDYLAKHPVDLVIISARWTDEDLQPLSETLDWLAQRHIKVVVLGPVMQYQYALPSILASSLREHDPALPARLEVRSLAKVDRDFAQLAASKHVGYGSSYDALCGSGQCTRLAGDRVPVQFDYGHLTADGSVLVARRLREMGVFSVYGRPPVAAR